MKIFNKIFILIIFIFFNSRIILSSEQEFRFGNAPLDVKPSEVTIKIDPELLKVDFKSLNDIQNSNNFIKRLSKNLKPSDEITLRGTASNIFSKFSESVFLIHNTDKKAIGAGTLIDRDGLVLTNLHVVEGAQFVDVYQKPPGNIISGLNGTKLYKGEVLLINKSNDLAIVKVTTAPKNIPIPQLGYIKDLKIGEEVHAIGHPNGYYWSYTKGTVSQIRSNFKWLTHQATVIQTQTPISQGNSGGPLFDNDGKLVGVNSAASEKGQNLNFSVAIDEAREMIRNKSNYIYKKNTSTSTSSTSSESSLSKSIYQKFPDAKTASSKNDGIIDMWWLKNKQTGKYDRALIDLKRRGVIDAMLVKTDKGSIIYLDEEKKGYWTHAVYYNKENEFLGSCTFNANKERLGCEVA